MRVNQIKTLCWTANLLVMGALAWAGHGFFGAVRGKNQIVEAEWPGADGAGVATVQTWPPPLATFKHTWETPVNGRVPPPPVPVEVKATKEDPKRVFESKFKYLGGMEVLNDPLLSSVSYQWGSGPEETLIVGGEVSGWQLVRFSRLVEQGADGDIKNSKSYDVMVFKLPARGPDDPEIVFELKKLASQQKLLNPEQRIEKPLQESPLKALVSRESIRQPMFPDPVTGDWRVSEEEQSWWIEFGEEALEKTGLQPHVDQQGVSHGLRFTTVPGEGMKALGTRPRGIGRDDILKSVNGEPVRSKEDLLGYLRGDGKGLRRYECLVERDGAERTVVYVLSSGFYRPQTPTEESSHKGGTRETSRR